ncbi:penicillin-binding transpeptidase domain-containing protein, partial [Ruminococcus sp.]|uniref:penicillin-binding transpeptidase domain-containing protein n=1 Tax=Ruminococcus sp. TaxID=41978 RepID=UPI002E7A38AE
YNQSKFDISDDTSDFMMMQTSFGQGETSSNPLHLALVMSAFANDGVLMKPHFASQIVSPSGRVVKNIKNKKRHCNVFRIYCRFYDIWVYSFFLRRRFYTCWN